MGCSASIGVNIASAVMAIAPVSVVLHILLPVPATVLDNAMATRVFRAVILGYIRESPDLRNSAVFTTAIGSCDLENSIELGSEEKSSEVVERTGSGPGQQV